MNRPLEGIPRALPAVVALGASVFLLGACGGETEREATGIEPLAAPKASEFPKPEGTLEEFLADLETTNEIIALPSSSVFTPGDERYGFALVDVAGEQILDAEAAVYVAHGPDGEASGPYPARLEDLTTEPAFVAQTTTPADAKGVYVSDVPFEEPGEWRLAAVVKEAGGLVATRLATSAMVSAEPRIPEIGEEAPAVETPTAEEVGQDLEEIDTRIPPSSMHEDDLADVLGKEPVVLLFATPALCQSRVCGPVVDVAEQVKSEYHRDAAFIHMEIYKGNEPQFTSNGLLDRASLRPQVRSYGLRSEPWLFVIDEEGRVRTRIEGPFSVHELEQALRPLVD